MNDHNEHTHTTHDVMRFIREGRIVMRPRWKFVLSGTLAALGVIILALTLLYIASFAIFGLRQSGVLFVPVFGMRGVFDFLHALPGVLIFLLVVFTAVLEILVRRYRFGYRAPLLLSAVAIILVVLLGGIAIERTRVHAQLFHQTGRHTLPQPINDMYAAAPPHVPDVFRGKVISMQPGILVMLDENGNGTTTVFIDKHTRLPFGADFETGASVVVFGDMATGGVHAIGIQEIGD